MSRPFVVVCVVVAAVAALVGYGMRTGHVASVGSLVSAAPYFVRMSWYGLLHGHERPARPNIPPEVQEWYTPRPSDVIISPAAKSGTTWLLQIAHQLRVKGEEPTWDDQMMVAPWLESAAWLGNVSHLVKGDHVAPPRVFKSHLPFGLLPDNVKLVVAVRDAGDVIVSMHKFWHPMVDTTWVQLHDHATADLLSGRVHREMRWLVEWWKHRNDPRVKFFFFKDMLANHRAVVEEMAAFMELDVNESVIDTVVSQSTHAYMSSAEHRHRFDDHCVVNRLRETHNLPPRGPTPLTGKVRKSGGKSGKGRMLLTDAHRAALDTIWQNIVEPETGFKNIEEMRAAWSVERGQAAAAVAN